MKIFSLSKAFFSNSAAGISLPLLIALSLPLTVAAQMKLEDCKAMMAQGQYDKASNELLKLINQPDQRNGRTPEVYYYLGFCRCQLNDSPTGRAWLEYGKRQAQPAQKAFFDDVISQCGQADTVSALPQTAARLNSQPGVTSRTKGGYFFGGKHLPDDESPNDPTIVGAAMNVASIPIETLRARLFAPERRSDAVAAIKKLMAESFPDQKYSVNSLGQFVFVSKESAWGWKPADLEKLERNLHRVMKFYETSYRMLWPERLITIYLARYPDELKAIATKIHGMNKSADVIGYSTNEDLSVAALTQSPDMWGTISHELFHLMVHDNFADIPNWLEEGMASAYAVARLENGRLIASNSNWRSAVLKRLFNPQNAIHVKDLVNLTWTDLEGGRTNEQQARGAVNHALICYLTLYLQERGKLAEVYFAYRNRKVPEELSDETLPLVRGFGKPLQEINDDFRKFLDKTLSVTR